MSLVHEDGAPRMRAPGQPDLRVLFVPKGRYAILDTWHAGGLRGSGSHDVVVDDVFVPDGRLVRTRSPGGEPLTAGPAPHLAVMVAGIGAQFLGMARAAIAVTLEILRTKVSVDPGASIRERPERARRHRVAQRCGRGRREPPPRQHGGRVGEGQTQLPTAEDRAALYSASLHAVAIGRAGVVAMHAAAGTPALYIDCPLERSVRDLHTMEQHIAAQPLWLEDAGRVLLGHEPTNPLFMI